MSRKSPFDRRDRTCDVSIEELRTWLKVPEGSYSDWKDCKKRVLEPALKQINDDPISAGFSVSYEPQRDGRSYQRIIFTMEKAALCLSHERQIRTAKARNQRLSDLKAQERPLLTEEAINRTAQETRYTLDMTEVERQFWEHWESTGNPTFNKGVAQAFMGFAKLKYRQTKTHHNRNELCFS